MKNTKDDAAALLDVFNMPLARCIDAIGSSYFYPRFFNVVKSLAKVEQYNSFEISPGNMTAICRLAYHSNRPEQGIQVASHYAKAAHKEDQLLQRLIEEATRHPAQPAFDTLDRRSLPPVYRQRFYNDLDLGDKFSIVAIDELTGKIFYSNFYRHKGASRFCESEIDNLKRFSGLLCSLLLKQFSGEHGRKDALKSLLAAELSEREAQICDFIARGHTAKTIARQLDLSESSVITYRKRAYRKLGIHRKSELLSLLSAA